MRQRFIQQASQSCTVPLCPMGFRQFALLFFQAIAETVRIVNITNAFSAMSNPRPCHKSRPARQNIVMPMNDISRLKKFCKESKNCSD
jgi:hypothetical protein